MSNNPFETIAYWLRKESLTPAEKRDMKQTLVKYATTHPVKSGLLSPYMFRYAMVALTSLIVVLGGSVGITSAAARALPNQPLYGVKLWIEDFKASTLKTPAEKIAYETQRINTRFSEATTLAVRHELNDSASQVIQAGLQHSEDEVNAEAQSIQDENPELALAATNNLQTAFSSNGKILQTIERSTNQNLDSIVLAAQVTTGELALENVKYEKIVLMKPNSETKVTTEQKLADVTAQLQALSSASAPTSDFSTATTAGTASSASSAPTASSTDAITADASTPAIVSSASSSGTASGDDSTAVTANANTLATPAALVQDAKENIDQGSYSQALVTLQKAQQVIDESTLTQSLETTYGLPATPDTTTDDTSPAAVPGQ